MCHKGNPLVFEANGVKVYAGGRNRDGGWHLMSPLPDLAMGPIGVINSAKKRDVLPVGWSITDTLNQGPTPTVLEIDWPDMGIPSNLGKEFWKALVVDIKVKGIKSISTMCVGGHGRTGVQLAILAHLLMEKDYHEWKTAEELILWVRKQYCENAVESKSQQKYISEVCDIPEGESVIHVHHSPWGDDFSASDLFTQSEIEAQKKIQSELDEQQKKRKRGKTRKKTDGIEWIGNPSAHFVEDAHYETPLVDGYSLTKCEECGTYEWRSASEEWMLQPCMNCNSVSVFPADGELINGENEVECFETGEFWHHVEMYDFVNRISFAAEAKRRDIKTRRGKHGVLEIKTGTRFHPTYFLIREGDEILPAWELHKRKKTERSEMRKMEREMSKFDEHSSVDSIYDTPRPTNDEIEPED